MMRRIYKSCTWSVIRDPLQVGGFEPGTKFSDQEIIFMLRHHSLTSGSVLQHRQLGELTVKKGARGCPFFLINAHYSVYICNTKLVINPLEMI